MLNIHVLVWDSLTALEPMKLTGLSSAGVIKHILPRPAGNIPIGK